MPWVLMADRIQRARIEEPSWQGGTSVLSGIRDLDSPTDYRECLPVPDRVTSMPESELVLLDDIPRAVRAKLWVITLIAVLICVILLSLLRS